MQNRKHSGCRSFGTFEIYFELFWKFFKLYLFESYGIETVGSKTVFRACFDKKLINEEELKKLIEVVEIRNNTSHIYNEILAQEVAEQVEYHYFSMKKLIDSINIHSALEQYSINIAS